MRIQIIHIQLLDAIRKILESSFTRPYVKEREMSGGTAAFYRNANLVPDFIFNKFYFWLPNATFNGGLSTNLAPVHL